MADPPVQLLEKWVAQPVVLRLKDNRTLAGKLLGCDEHLNLVLDDVEETSSDVRRRLGRVVLRGSSVVTVDVPGVAARPR